MMEVSACLTAAKYQDWSSITISSVPIESIENIRYNIEVSLAKF